MKQHMLTHKIRDMPQHMFENKPPNLSGDESTPLPPSMPKLEAPSGDVEREPQPHQQPLQQPHLQPHQQQPHQQPLAAQPPPNLQPPQVPSLPEKHEVESQQIKREPTETELPLPKRPPSKYIYVGIPNNNQRQVKVKLEI